MSLSNLSKQELLQRIKELNEEIKNEMGEMKEEGFTHLVEWWDHSLKGDDVQKGTYFKGEPRGRDFTSIKRKSNGDFKVKKL